ncbi:hypothetical protein [Bradyrhizobium sp. STM 3566]|uniref:hypothetical protein n=1 Tax=Bradyrhizobium sp. STM 3566 TaxID=578928 RepID=UPI00388E7CAA
MNQRNDLLTFSLLLFSVLLVVLISMMPKDLDSIWRWQTLIGNTIGGTITGFGVLVAAWNVTRQMRLAAQAREEDRIERELPALKAVLRLTWPFVLAAQQLPGTAGLLRAFEMMGGRSFDLDTIAEAIEEKCVGIPDFISREMGFLLYPVHSAAIELRARNNDYERARDEQRSGFNPTEEELRIESRFELAHKRCSETLEEFLKYRDGLKERTKLERQRLDFLRRERDRMLGLR